jgi:hypothetical protein
MRTFRKAVLLGLLLVPVAATPARAAGLVGFFDFLDHLSGPGPFVGGGVDITLVCDDGEGNVTANCLWRTGRVGVSTERRLRPRRFEAGPHVSWLRGAINDDLVYPAGTTDDARRVNAFTYGGHAYFWMRQPTGSGSPWIGATLRLTAVRFSGDLVRDGSLTSTMVGLGPIFGFPFGGGHRLDVTPLAQFGLGPFDAADFGASGPALDSDSAKFTIRVGVLF